MSAGRIRAPDARRSIGVVSIRAPHALAAALCTGLAGSLLLPVRSRAAVGVVALLVLAGSFLRGSRRTIALALALATAGAWWGTARLDALDASALAPLAGEAGVARVEVTGQPRAGRFALRVPVRVRRFDRLDLDEPARLELPLGRAPPQGALLQVVATIELPRGPDEAGGFDEAAYLGRQGVHAILRAGFYRELGRRRGLRGLVDRLRERLAASIAPGLDGERRALVAGVVLGADEELSEPLRDDFRASGLYHLLR